MKKLPSYIFAIYDNDFGPKEYIMHYYEFNDAKNYLLEIMNDFINIGNCRLERLVTKRMTNKEEHISLFVRELQIALNQYDQLVLSKEYTPEGDFNHFYNNGIDKIFIK